jgi:rRNA maturation endonuclease Nob1
MAEIELVCRACKHPWRVTTQRAIKAKQKRCPECGSETVRQTMSSFLRNGPLSNPNCGAPPPPTRYG